MNPIAHSEPTPAVAPVQLRAAYGVCRHVARSAARNFYYGFLVLPRRKRDAISAVYAFMRHADDISDDPLLSPEEKRLRLQSWRERMHRVLAGDATDDPVLMALADTQRRFQLPPELLDKLVEGTLMDLSAPQSSSAVPGVPVVLYDSFEQLYRYCYHVASVVGLVSIRIFGYRDPAAELLAERTGVAFQLTNIIRDVEEDALLGRVYLPREDLERFGIDPALLVNGGPGRALEPQLAPLLAMEAERARELYASADALLPLIDEDAQPALWTLVEIYRRLLDKIAARNFAVFGGRIRLTTREKLAVLSRGLLRRLA
jgi:phytoene synthase